MCCIAHTQKNKSRFLGQIRDWNPAEAGEATCCTHHESRRKSNGTEVIQSFLKPIIHCCCTTYQAYEQCAATQIPRAPRRTSSLPTKLKAPRCDHWESAFLIWTVSYILPGSSCLSYVQFPFFSTISPDFLNTFAHY